MKIFEITLPAPDEFTPTKKLEMISIACQIFDICINEGMDGRDASVITFLSGIEYGKTYMNENDSDRVLQ